MQLSFSWKHMLKLNLAIKSYLLTSAVNCDNLLQIVNKTFQKRKLEAFNVN